MTLLFANDQINSKFNLFLEAYFSNNYAWVESPSFSFKKFLNLLTQFNGQKLVNDEISSWAHLHHFFKNHFPSFFDRWPEFWRKLYIECLEFCLKSNLTSLFFSEDAFVFAFKDEASAWAHSHLIAFVLGLELAIKIECHDKPFYFVTLTAEQLSKILQAQSLLNDSASDSKDYLIKTVRTKQFDFWHSFCDSITKIPEQTLANDFRIRNSDHLYSAAPDSVYLLKNKPQRFTNEQMLEKAHLSAPQSFSLGTEKHLSAFFGHEKDRKDCLVGIKVAAQKSKINRYHVYDGGTHTAPWRGHSDKALKYILSLLKENKVFSDYQLFKNRLESQNDFTYNEVLARVRFDLKDSAIIIFSDNLPSRWLALGRARILKQKLKSRELALGNEWHDDYKVPIFIYPNEHSENFVEYLAENQQTDTQQALDICLDHKLQNEALENNIIEYLFLAENIQDIFSNKKLISNLIARNYFYIVVDLIEKAILNKQDFPILTDLPWAFYIEPFFKYCIKLKKTQVIEFAFKNIDFCKMTLRSFFLADVINLAGHLPEEKQGQFLKYKTPFIAQCLSELNRVSTSGHKNQFIETLKRYIPLENRSEIFFEIIFELFKLPPAETKVNLNFILYFLKDIEDVDKKDSVFQRIILLQPAYKLLFECEPSYYNERDVVYLLKALKFNPLISDTDGSDPTETKHIPILVLSLDDESLRIQFIAMILHKYNKKAQELVDLLERFQISPAKLLSYLFSINLPAQLFAATAVINQIIYVSRKALVFSYARTFGNFLTFLLKQNFHDNLRDLLMDALQEVVQTNLVLIKENYEEIIAVLINLDKRVQFNFVPLFELNFLTEEQINLLLVKHLIGKPVNKLAQAHLFEFIPENLRLTCLEKFIFHIYVDNLKAILELIPASQSEEKLAFKQKYAERIERCQVSRSKLERTSFWMSTSNADLHSAMINSLRKYSKKSGI